MEDHEDQPELKESAQDELTLQIEQFERCWPEGRALVLAEAAEVEPDGRNLEPDISAYITNEQLGLINILVARKGGKIVGYLCWQIDFDMESYGTLIANQNAWYVAPGHYGVADKMFDWAVNYFKSLGVKFVYWHHTEHGRGKTLGRYFKRKGCKLISHNYALKL